MPRIEYGPPGHKGVTQIMGLGLDIPSPIKVLPASDKPLQDVGLGAVVVYIGGHVVGSNTAKNIALGALAAVLMVKGMMKARDRGLSTPPQTLQGW